MTRGEILLRRELKREMGSTEPLLEEEIKDVQKAIKELQQENKQLQQQCKKQQEVIDNINLIIKGLAYGGDEDYYMENFSKINELLKEVSE